MNIPRRFRRPLHCAPVAVTLLLALPAPSLAQPSAADMYARAQEREAAARQASAPAVATLRDIGRAYWAIVYHHPTSGYCDNALWQGAGMFALAYQRSGDPADRREAERLLNWLRTEYPHSPLLGKVAGALDALHASPSPPAAASPAPPGGGESPAAVRSVIETPLADGDRITVELTHEVSYSGDRVDKPDRVFFDLANSSVSTAAIAAAQTLSGTLVSAVRVGRHDNDVTRIVLELAGSAEYSTFPLYNPFRLVIDVQKPAAQVPPATGGTWRVPAVPADIMPTPQPFPTRGDSEGATLLGLTQPPGRVTVPPAHRDAPPPASAKAGAPATVAAIPAADASKPADPPIGQPAPPAINSNGDYSLARQLGLSVSRVVIDPGHGGHDPGAQANGITEADLVLDISLRLEKLLKAQPGFDVVLTRRTDTYVPLEERTAIANREGADLFLSIHANASRQPATHGIETYFLNFATTPAAEAVAARENASSEKTMGTLPDILKAIALNNKLAESRDLATIVQTTLVRRLAIQNTAVKDLGVKQAPFVVLIGAQMPSVLAEISFLTNRPTASLLKESSYRQRIAQALCDAIVKYQATLKKVTTVASKGRQR
jgi:N-acetylmuramoyl-L-alanine amidase